MLELIKVLRMTADGVVLRQAIDHRKTLRRGSSESTVRTKLGKSLRWMSFDIPGKMQNHTYVDITRLSGTSRCFKIHVQIVNDSLNINVLVYVKKIGFIY